MSDYSKKLMMYFSGAAVMNCLALARELGIIQLLMESSQPVTSQEVANKLDLKERYVRELLGTLAVGEVVAVDETSTLFHVPDENKSALDPVSVFSTFIPIQGERFLAVESCCRKSGPRGIRYSDFPRVFDLFHNIAVSAKKDILDLDILPVVPDGVKKLGFLTFFVLHGVWKDGKNKRTPQYPESGITVAEFGCSDGVLLNQLAARFPKSSFLGSDVATGPLDQARMHAANQNLQNVRYDVHDLETLPESLNDKFDWVYVRDVIHDLPYPQKALNELYRTVKPGGILSVIDVGLSGEVVKEVGDPFSMFYYAASSFFCICESHQRPDSAALGPTWGIPLAQEMLKKAGFTILKQSVSKYDPKEIHFVLQK